MPYFNKDPYVRNINLNLTFLCLNDLSTADLTYKKSFKQKPRPSISFHSHLVFPDLFRDSPLLSRRLGKEKKEVAIDFFSSITRTTQTHIFCFLGVSSHNLKLLQIPLTRTEQYDVFIFDVGLKVDSLSVCVNKVGLSFSFSTSCESREIDRFNVFLSGCQSMSAISQITSRLTSKL